MELTKSNHVVISSKTFYEYLKEITFPIGKKEESGAVIRKKYEIYPDGKIRLVTLLTTFTQPNGFIWIGNRDLKCFIELFTEYDINDIDPESFAYRFVEGLYTPFKKHEGTANMSGNYYELHITFKIK